MQRLFDQFTANIDRVRTIHQLYITLGKQVMPIMDLTDLLRAEVVLAVSALDYLIHELTREGMLEIWRGERPATTHFDKFSIPLSAARATQDDAAREAAISEAIRVAHGWKSFQTADNIADAIRLFCPVSLWSEVAALMNEDAKDVKIQLGLIVDRRNKIAHEADINPTLGGDRWEITPEDVVGVVNFLRAVAGHICSVTKA